MTHRSHRPTPSSQRSAHPQPKPRPAAPAPPRLPAHTLPDLLADLATLTRNQISTGASEHTFARLAAPTALQTHALELLDIKLHT